MSTENIHSYIVSSHHCISNVLCAYIFCSGSYVLTEITEHIARALVNVIYKMHWPIVQESCLPSLLCLLSLRLYCQELIMWSHIINS